MQEETNAFDKMRQFSGFSQVSCNIRNLNGSNGLNTKIELKSLNIVCGYNGAGKSLMNKFIWVAALYFNSLLTAKLMGEDISNLDKAGFQFMLDTTFDNNDFDGEFEFHIRDEVLKVSWASLKFNLVGGQLTDLLVDQDFEIIPGGNPVYMSKIVRDFGEMEKYALLKKLLNVDLTTEDGIKILTKHYKLYDVLTFEKILNGFKSNIDKYNAVLGLSEDNKLAVQIAETMPEFQGVKELQFDEEESILYYVTKDEKRRKMSTMSAGAQSLFIMFGTMIETSS